MGLDFIYTNKQTVPEPGFFFLHVIMLHIISFFVSGNHSMPPRPNLLLSGEITFHCIKNLIMFCSAMHCYHRCCRCRCRWEPKPLSVQPLTTIRVWARAKFLLNTNTSYALRHAYFFPGPSAPSLWLSVGGWPGSCGLTIQVYHIQRGHTHVTISSTRVN